MHAIGSQAGGLRPSLRPRRSDGFFVALSRAADHSVPWIAVSALLAVGGRRPALFTAAVLITSQRSPRSRDYAAARREMRLGVAVTTHLGLLPLGTSNDFARSLGIPVDPPSAVGLFAGGKVATVDLGRFTPEDQPLSRWRSSSAERPPVPCPAPSRSPGTRCASPRR